MAHNIYVKLARLLFRRFEPHSALACVILLILVPALLSAPISYAGRSTYTALPLAFAAYWSGLLFFTLAYRLSPLHPLANYPGPILAKSSKLWGAYLGAIGDQHRCRKRLHDRYGDVVRIGSRSNLPFETPRLRLPGPNELSIRDASLIHPVLGQGGLPKGPGACKPCSMPENVIICDG